MDLRAIVPVKQVPIAGRRLGVRPHGTIDRGAGAAITNPADLHAIEAALTLSDEVWALSMGPPNAEAALREAVALGVTRAVLLCDRLWAGSDTWATSNALAAAICQLGGADVVLCGISALEARPARWRTTCANCRSGRRTRSKHGTAFADCGPSPGSRSLGIMTASPGEVVDRSVAPRQSSMLVAPVDYG